jgi:hypothetical protein
MQGSFTCPFKGIVVLSEIDSAVELIVQSGFETILWECHGRDSREPNNETNPSLAPARAIEPAEATSFGIKQSAINL